MILSLYSEPYRPQGNIDARATRRALSQSDRLDTWDLLLRETLQNSWDARTDRDGPIHFRVDVLFPDESQSRVLRQRIFTDLPPIEAFGEEPSPVADDYPVLVISDWGTRGLAGPTRADISERGRVDFIDFIRNVGRAEDKELGGGTYGFGKGVLYETSICSTVLAFSRTHDETGSPASRLMAIRLGSSYDKGGLRFTGRHWWGRPDDLTGAEPVTGSDAEQLAEGLGLTMIPAAETGTSLMVIGPVAKHDDETVADVVDRLATAALYWAWPHMVGRKTIDFQFVCEGETVEVPDPVTHPVLRDFVASFHRAEAVERGDALDSNYQWQDEQLRSGPGSKTLLGSLSLRRRLPGDEPSGKPSDMFVGNHVALMRTPRFVVRYREAPNDPAGRTVAGVFLANPDLDGTFALAEPPAHDDWIPGNIPTKKFERNPVRQALTRLNEALKPPRANPVPAESAAMSGGLVQLAGSLGSLLQGLPGGVDARIPVSRPTPSGRSAGVGAGGGEGAASRGGRRRAQTIGARVSGAPMLRLVNGRLLAVFPVEVAVPDGATVALSGSPRVMVEGGAEREGEAPIGAPFPKLIGWSDVDAAAADDPGDRGERLVGGPGPVELWAWVSQPPDTAVGLTLACRLPD